ncbi:TonB-dependent receptor [Mucilaginibacter sabulilitoris]|uniref:TonB-dependent receptor n=1 Tax=Mucilaginibacter sabulilitoris TaxID=1173583 RepID=A0ABZ0TKX5_9SPHI|nr:TonB-dependent receptor [Mucilaginibacter sabulilitoris]WPU92843.1 TonB-dependent receptor [Mucilaginibacter sabulilitoris]
MRRKLLLRSFFACAMLLCCSACLLLAQERIGAGTVIKGSVVSADGLPLSGATITEKNTGNVKTTAQDGTFTIALKRTSNRLVVSFIGFITQEVEVKRTAPLKVQLEASSNSLQDVVVVGYGQRKKVDLTGSVVTVSSKDLQNRPVTDVAQALQGQVANLNITQSSGGGSPAAAPNINVRGYTGFGVSASPLIVIDGVPGGDINNINAADIESISILKDAASSAIYGSSAPYGVMLITTRQGKKNQRTTISYNNNFSLAQTINLPHMVNSLDFANIYNEAFVNSGRAPWFSDETIQRIKDYQAGALKTETIKDPNNDDWLGSGIGYFTGTGPNTGNGNNDWFKIFFKPWSFSQQHNISVNGGGANSSYYVGAGLLDKNGMYNFMKDTYKRYNLRANISSNVSDIITLNFRSSFSRELSNTPATYAAATGGNYMHQIARKLPTTPLKNPDGNYSDYSNINLFTQGGRDIYTNDKPMLTGEVVLKPVKGLNLTANFTYDGQNYNESDFNKTVYTVLPSGNKVVEFQTDPNNSLAENYLKQDHYITNIYASYDKHFGAHNFQLLGGYIKDYTRLTSLNASNSLLYSNDIPSLNLTYNPTPSVGDNDMRLSIEGFFGRFNYNYKDKYLLEVNGRYDASSRFLAGHRWNLYPSVSAGYVVSEEAFWKSIQPTVNVLKIRASYGSLGDQWGDNPDRNNYYPFYPSLGTVAPTSTNWIFGDGRQAYIAPPGLVNPNLTWATIKSANIGLDAEVLKNRLAIAYDWYVRNASDFVGPAQSLPSVLGTSVPKANNAAMRTTGFELTVSWRDHIGKFNYFAKGVLSNATSKVVKYPNSTSLLSDWYEGMKMGEIWGYQTAGLFQSAAEVASSPNQQKIFGGNWTAGDVKYNDLNKDGIIDYGNNTLSNHGDLKIIGNNTPQYTYGLSLGGSFKNFDVSFFVQGVAKRDVWIGSNMYWGIIGGEWQSTVLDQNLDRWTPNAPNGFFPKYYMTGEMNKNMQVQTRYLQNAAYLRIKNIQVGYTLPALLISKIGVQKVRIYLSGDNLATFTKLQQSIDPELAVGDAKLYPIQRIFSAGLNVTL